MIYTVQKGRLIAEQLRKFSHSDSWMVVGQFVNIEFWVEEVKASLKAIKETRKELIDSIYYFLIRCYKLKLISEEELRLNCNNLGTSIDINDLSL